MHTISHQISNQVNTPLFEVGTALYRLVWSQTPHDTFYHMSKQMIFHGLEQVQDQAFGQIQNRLQNHLGDN